MRTATRKLYLLGLAVILIAQTGLASDLNGKWDFVFTTEQGDRQYAATLQVEGEKVSGKFGPKDAQVKGTFASRRLELKFPFASDEGGKEDLTISGKLDGEKLTGSWEFGGYSGSFVAKRAK
ncbi:MAG: hypothetical protein ACREVR_03010 [Burkholderiales bacterium]